MKHILFAIYVGIMIQCALADRKDLCDIVTLIAIGHHCVVLWNEKTREKKP